MLAFVTLVTFIQFRTVDSNYSEVIEDRLQRISLINDMIDSARDEQLAVRAYLVSGEDRHLDKFNQERELFDKSAKEFLNLGLLPDARALAEELISAEVDYNSTAQKMINYKGQGNAQGYVYVMQSEEIPLTERIAQLGEDSVVLQEQNMIDTSGNLSQQTNRTTNFILLISISAIIFGLVVAVVISLIISNPVKAVAKAAKEIAAGNLAVEDIHVKNKDEIGELAASFNQMAGNLRDLISQASLTAEHVASSAEELMAGAVETNTVTEQVVASIQEVATGTEVQGKNTAESANAVREMATGVQRVADTTSRIADSASDTAKQAMEGSQYLAKVTGQMDSIYNSNNQTHAVIKELNAHSQQIGDIISVITGIAQQTNLLALNAAIESARAGEHGRGFAVVADEVRKLAEQSRVSAEQISELITHIQNATSQVVGMMDAGTREVSEGMQLVKETARTFDTIIGSIEQVSSEIQDVSAIGEQMSAGVEQVSASIDEVESISRISAANINEIASASEEQLASMQEVNAAASSLASAAEDLRAMIGKFKI
ncbi:methyl-accepting chemotaxis protein [Paenibacillus sp. PK3_47]|uniref:methyl-accepting chemotaxis protein n=1 Tax=Paenibacillus sp. PK3_47 TaxID=2072642 RepID=UPI00201D3C84|nr:methyl-accepting chemotaxis protein [Paenibacillus sp. PK3_47]